MGKAEKQYRSIAVVGKQNKGKGRPAEPQPLHVK